MARSLTSGSASRTHDIGRLLAPLLESGDVIALSGDLGAGKTTLIKGIAEGLGLEETVASPTFNILVVHPGGRLVLNHFDLYRLECAEQLEDIDFWGVLETDGVSVVEWGDRFPGAMPADLLLVEIAVIGDEERTISLSEGGARSADLMDRWVAAATGGDA